MKALCLQKNAGKSMAIAEPIHRKKHMTSFQIIILSFAPVILAGAALLMLPISSKNAVVTPFHETLFTAVSAACVTGLVVKDTASHWSLFGQGVILLLIQIGGMGVVTVAAAIAGISGKKISLMQRSTMQEAIAAPKMGGIVKLTGFIIKATLLFELFGALAMAPVFYPEYGIRGLWMAVFHSVSAFCNAGFDLMGTPEAPFVSLTSYEQNPVVNTVIMLLIILGGIGFLTWEDIWTNKFRFKRYRMQSKVILTTTLILLVFPAIYFYQYEFMKLPFGERLWCSLFQSVTPRTAGFNTADLTKLTGAGQCIIIILMLIGGSPGSTAGGMKTTTAAVLLGNAFAVFCRKEDARFFGRRTEADVIKHAATILAMYLTLFVSAALLISIWEGLPMGTCLFETASAIGTVGLTLGITPGLGRFSQALLMILMFFGRVGGLTLIYAALPGTGRNYSRLPQEKITVG